MSKKETKETKYIGFTASKELAEWLESESVKQSRSVSKQISFILEGERSVCK